jgi:hypothetical protein
VTFAISSSERSFMMLSRVKYSLRFSLFMVRKYLHVLGRASTPSTKNGMSCFFWSEETVDGRVG